MAYDILHQARLAARLHDPIEKALILMRTREGHEGGTSRVLREQLFPGGVPGEVAAAVRRADHWASAADRAAFPKHERDGRHPAWQSVRFDQEPVLIHPLTGKPFALRGELTDDIEPAAASSLARRHLEALVHEGDPEKTALAFWRFGPELAATGASADRLDGRSLANLWRLLPADTRVPDHTIHDHLDLTAALAAAFAGDPDGGPALLAVSLGPVQEFIAAARSTSDLWASSHLLSRIAWEAMRVICEQLGPEAILFPRLRAVPQVDLWLREDRGLRAGLFAGQPWTQRASDANPLFAAALPNRFTALVPAYRARALAEQITERTRTWVREQAEAGLGKLLEAAGVSGLYALPAHAQIADQLAGFPEVHWAAVPWSLVGTDLDGRVDASDTRLAEAMRPFFAGNPPGYVGTRAWELLSGGLRLEEGWFYRPNPGALYPALHELLERLLAASKAARGFPQQRQLGWRDSLTGEAEWLTTDREQLDLPPGQRTDTLWTRVAGQRPSWAKKGEHLAAHGMLKRLWPTLFVEEVGSLLEGGALNRFVVSTHTMAVAGTLRSWLRQRDEVPQWFRERIAGSGAPRVALPRKLATSLRDHPERETLLHLPGWLEAEGESEDPARIEQARRDVEKALGRKLEAYYGLLLMDGDSMGAWLSAGRGKTRPIQKSYHPQIRHAASNRFGGDQRFADYAKENNAATPSRHLAISDALNQFALRLVPAVVEESFAGRVLYAGGDDVLAMLPVLDLVPAITALRAVYSGSSPQDMGHDDDIAGPALRRQANGFVEHRGEVLRLMGKRATASCGAVIAHHQAPLGAVLRELHAAEQRAKREGGRDAFSLTVIKRSGGALSVTAKWGEPVRALLELTDLLRAPGVSRRAVYASVDWLKDVPPDAPDIMQAVLGQQLQHKGVDQRASGVAARLVGIARNPGLRPADADCIRWLTDFMQIAEFLAREAHGAGTEEAAA